MATITLFVELSRILAPNYTFRFNLSDFRKTTTKNIPPDQILGMILYWNTSLISKLCPITVKLTGLASSREISKTVAYYLITVPICLSCSTKLTVEIIDYIAIRETSLDCRLHCKYGVMSKEAAGFTAIL